jgi:hypothetical protein
MAESSLPSCENCRHRYLNRMNCEAFPRGIPLFVLSGDVPHTEPIPGDRGIQYEPVTPDHPFATLPPVPPT